MRVLLADPDSEFLEIVQRFLWDRGHEVEIVVDGLECIAMLREYLPDILVIDRDLLWGGSDGVLEQMDEDLQLSKIPVILTADGTPTNESSADARTTVACLPKPYRLHELLTHIQLVAAAIHSSSSCFDCDSVKRSIPTYYLQACPVCGRPLHVPVQLLGRTVACQHCRGTFVAVDPNCQHHLASDPRPLLEQQPMLY